MAKLQACRLVITVLLTLSLLIYILYLSVNPFNTHLHPRLSRSPSSTFSSSFPIPTPCLPSISSSTATLLLPPPPDTPPELLDYITFHRTARHCLLSPSPSCPFSSPPPVLVFRNKGTRGGFGFRLGAIRWAFLLAVATRRVLFIEWPQSKTGVSFDLTAALLPASIDWRLPVSSVEQAEDMEHIYANALTELIHRQVGGRGEGLNENIAQVDMMGMRIRSANLTGVPKKKASLSVWVKSIERNGDGDGGEHDEDDGDDGDGDDGDDGDDDEDDDDDDDDDDTQTSTDGDKPSTSTELPTTSNTLTSSFHSLKTANLSAALAPFAVVHTFLHYRRRLIRKLLFNPFHQTSFHTLSSSSSFEHDDTFIMSLERNVTHLLFRPSPVVSALARARTGAAPGEAFVSVHMRTGDDVHEGKQRRMKLVLSNMTSHAERMLDCAKEIHPAGQRRVFLASDSMSFKKVFKERAQKRGVNVSTQTERPSVHLRNYGATNERGRDNFPFALSFSFSSQREEVGDVDTKCMQFLDVFADVVALGSGSGMVARLSSFASAALALGETTRAIQLYLALGAKNGECDVVRLAEEEVVERARMSEEKEKRRKKRGVTKDANRLHVLWYDGRAESGGEGGEGVVVGRIGDRLQYVGHGNRVGLYAEEVFNMTSGGDADQGRQRTYSKLTVR